MRTQRRHHEGISISSMPITNTRKCPRNTRKGIKNWGNKVDQISKMMMMSDAAFQNITKRFSLVYFSSTSWECIVISMSD